MADELNTDYLGKVFWKYEESTGHHIACDKDGKPITLQAGVTYLLNDNS